MQRLGSLLCLIAVASAQIDPRGARPVEHGTRGDKCATKKEWPFCTSDDWGSKCPSGCRIQGLVDMNDHGLLKRVDKIRNLLDQNKAKHRTADHGSKQTYSYIREKLVLDSGSNTNFYDLAQTLRQRITDMKIKIDGQSRTLAAMKQRVKDQVLDMQKLEIDIDIKLRSCKGSCAKYQEHQVDRDSYVSLDKQIQQLDSQSAQTVQSVGTLYVMKSRPLKDLNVDPNFKSRDVDPTADPTTAQQTVEVFTDVNTMHLILEEEGSSSSPATVSKVPGTSFSPSSSGTSPSSPSSSSSKSITELGGGGGGGDPFGPGGFDASHVTTQSVSCTKSIRRTVVHTKDGPVERLEEVVEGGPQCQALVDGSKGGAGSLFPTLGHASSTKTLLSGAGGTKGSILGDAKTGFGDPFGDPFGGDFLTDVVEDDVPDFKARSVMGRRVQRQAGYVGKGTETSQQE